MLETSRVIAFIPTRDAVRARAFLEGILALRFVAEDNFALVFEVAGTMIRYVKIDDFVPASYTVLGWQVIDIRASVAELASKGVTFERYPGMPQDDLGIWASDGAEVAWFKDPDGNLLSLTQLR